MSHTLRLVVAVACLAVVPACDEPLEPDDSVDRLLPWPQDDAQPIPAAAAFSCDFGVNSSMSLDEVAPVIERDRMYMAEWPGMIHGKHLPMSIDLAGGQLWSGGRYLFQTEDQAEAYAQFVTEDYTLDGVQFLERESFTDPDCGTWSTIAAFELGDIESDHVLIRTERWWVPTWKNQRKFLVDYVPALLEQAQQMDRSGIWLLYDRKEQLVEIVQIAGPLIDVLPGELNAVGLAALAASPSMGAELEDRGYVKVLDRSHFVLTIWFPFVPGDQGAPSLWPNSPPLPEPRCDDGVCSVSRGEDHASCPQDCPPDCGDATCQPGENTQNCPGDCRL